MRPGWGPVTSESDMARSAEQVLQHNVHVLMFTLHALQMNFVAQVWCINLLNLFSQT